MLGGLVLTCGRVGWEELQRVGGVWAVENGKYVVRQISCEEDGEKWRFCFLLESGL